MPPFAKPGVGTALTIMAGLSTYFLLMILPLVGPAAVHGSGSPGSGPAPHLVKNYIAFTSVLILSLALAALAATSKLQRRKIDGSPLPWYSLALCTMLILMAVALVFGLFAI